MFFTDCMWHVPKKNTSLCHLGLYSATPGSTMGPAQNWHEIRLAILMGSQFALPTRCVIPEKHLKRNNMGVAMFLGSPPCAILELIPWGRDFNLLSSFSHWAYHQSMGARCVNRLWVPTHTRAFAGGWSQRHQGLAGWVPWEQNKQGKGAWLMKLL